MDVPTERRLLHTALLAQGYERVAVEKLTPAGDIDLTDATVPAELEHALTATTSGTNWTHLAQQFALLKQMEGGHFDNLYMKVGDELLRLVIVARYGTSPLRMEWLERDFDYAWPVVANLEGLLEKFPLPAAAQEAGRKLIETYFSSNDPATQAVASLLNAALGSRLVDSGPYAAFCAICEAGATPELIGRLDQSLLKKKTELSLHVPYLAGFIWDLTTGQIHGKDLMGGGTMSPTQLRGSIAGQ
jgi:hypothetical protein